MSDLQATAPVPAPTLADPQALYRPHPRPPLRGCSCTRWWDRHRRALTLLTVAAFAGVLVFDAILGVLLAELPKLFITP